MLSITREFWRLAAGYRRQYVAAVAALAMGTFIAYLIPLVTRATIDAIVVEPAVQSAGWRRFAVDSLGGSATLRAQLWIAAVLIALLAVASGCFMYLKGRWAARASEGIIRRLRDRLYDHLQYLPCRFHDDTETGDLVQRCTSDVETVRHFLALQVVEIGRSMILLLTVIPIMFALDVRMAMVSLAGAPVIVGFGLFFFQRIKPVFLTMDEAEGRMTSVLQENLTGIRVVRAFARQDFEQEKFAERNQRFRDSNYRLIKLLAVYWPLSDVLVFAQQAGVLLAGAYWVGMKQMSVGTLVAFLLFVNMYIWPLRQMGRILADLGKALVALGRIEEILAVDREKDCATAAEPQLETPQPVETDVRQPLRLRGSISFDQVSFAYDGTNDVLNHISFDVQPGQTLAIVGPSGAGKSTIVNLLLRLYDGATGSICIDGRPLEEFPRRAIRSQISVVMQEPFLYSKTVRENIALGRSDAEEDELHEAAGIAAVHDAIIALDNGYETPVGERGVTLSGGQRQRVALARAMLQRPAILVLDDALSAVDTETETLILQALRERRGSHTTLAIAHRLSTLREADRIVVLDRGRVLQSGTHESLLAEDGLYRRLWQIQGESAAAAV